MPWAHRKTQAFLSGLVLECRSVCLPFSLLALLVWTVPVSIVLSEFSRREGGSHQCSHAPPHSRRRVSLLHTLHCGHAATGPHVSAARKPVVRIDSLVFCLKSAPLTTLRSVSTVPLDMCVQQACMRGDKPKPLP